MNTHKQSSNYQTATTSNSQCQSSVCALALFWLRSTLEQHTWVRGNISPARNPLVNTLPQPHLCASAGALSDKFPTDEKPPKKRSKSNYLCSNLLIALLWLAATSSAHQQRSNWNHKEPQLQRLSDSTKRGWNFQIRTRSTLFDERLSISPINMLGSHYFFWKWMALPTQM